MRKHDLIKYLNGPFLRSSGEDKWHWMENCPYFPRIDNPNTSILSAAPDYNTLCSVCRELELEHEKSLNR